MTWRILHVIRSLRPETGGLVEAVRNLGPALEELGHSSTILSLDPADLGRAGASVIVQGRSSHGYGRSPRYVRWLQENRQNYDAVIIHGLWQQQGSGAWKALHGTQTPYFVFCHGMLDPWFRRTYPLKHWKKWLYWSWAEYRVLRDAAGVCFTAEDERHSARKSFWPYCARELVTPLGIAPPPDDAAHQTNAFFAAHPALQGKRFLLFLGRIHQKKGLHLVFDAYAELISRKQKVPLLVIAGPHSDDAYMHGLKEQSTRLGIDRFLCWTGMLAGAAKWGAIRSCDAFVLVSHGENFGVAVVEALSCGKPVLISRAINIWREIEGGNAGWAAEDTADGASDLLNRWLQAAPATRAAMSTAAHRCYEERFSSSKAALHLMDTLQGAVRHPLPWFTRRHSLDAAETDPSRPPPAVDSPTSSAGPHQ